MPFYSYFFPSGKGLCYNWMNVVAVLDEYVTTLQMAEAVERLWRPQATPAAPTGAVSSGGGSLPHFRQEGLDVQQLVWERRGRPHWSRPLQLYRGDQGGWRSKFTVERTFVSRELVRPCCTIRIQPYGRGRWKQHLYFVHVYFHACLIPVNFGVDSWMIWYWLL